MLLLQSHEVVRPMHSRFTAVHLDMRAAAAAAAAVLFSLEMDVVLLREALEIKFWYT